VEVLLYTGLRRRELFLLQWRDVDFGNGVIRLRSETTKTARARTVPLLSNVRSIFQAIRHKSSSADPKARIFDGGENSAAMFSAQLKAACDKLGLGDVTAHALRHTFSTRANRFGVDPFAQKESLGHAKLSQTADYTHQSGETFLKNFAGFENHLNNRQNFGQLADG
jgi:integrase